MIFAHVEFHNVEELPARPDGDGRLLQRVPEAVRLGLNANAQERMRQPAGVEIRFTSARPGVRVTLSAPHGNADVMIFHGLFQSNQRLTVTEQPTSFEISLSPRLEQLDPRWAAGMPFSPRVYRLMFAGNPVCFHDIEGENLAPPTPVEVPNLRFIAYGTSITQGERATGPHLTYLAQLARRLAWDAFNLGSSGSAACEPHLARYIAHRRDWHLALLEVSINMLGMGFSPDEYAQRVSVMLDTIGGGDPGRPVACLTLFPNYRELTGGVRQNTDRGTPEEFRVALRRAVRQLARPNVHLVEGPDILPDVAGLTRDLVHPGDFGMTQIADSLANRLAPWIARHPDTEGAA